MPRSRLPAAQTPRLPRGRCVTLPGRGETFVREIAGPPGAPTLVLLHGWLATADLNWFRLFGELGEHYGIVAMDHRGHGRGLRSCEGFTLAACADDVAALIEELGIEQPIVVGYSMGGPVAMLTSRRHAHLVGGLVICASAPVFLTTARQLAVFRGVGLALAVAPPGLRTRLLRTALTRDVSGHPLERWITSEVESHVVRDVVEAGFELSRFDARDWIGEIRTPAAVVVTGEDGLVPPQIQRSMAAAIPGATVHEVAGDHVVVVNHVGRFLPVFLDAVASVARRLGAVREAGVGGGAA